MAVSYTHLDVYKRQVSQPTLSAGLKELENILGTQLVERDRQVVLMTRIGLEIARRARVILAATHDLADLAAGALEPMTGRLRLGVIPTIAPFVLPLSLPLLRERYPELQLALREDVTVSYTHLDVYKRQNLSGSRRKNTGVLLPTMSQLPSSL